MILDDLSQYAKTRVLQDKKSTSLEEIKTLALNIQQGDFRFEKALKANFPSLICEVKKASPSKGIISEDFPYLQIAKEYEKLGATCVSILTEPKWFLGSDDIFKEIRKNVNLPLLRKDFTVDEYQIYQAKVMGADAILLIVSILSEEQIKQYLKICDNLGISALVETHDEHEISIATRCGARIIGVNNRNLKDFTVNLSNSSQLKSFIPSNVIYVAESGILTPNDGINLIKNGANSLLIGEALMRCENIKCFIQTIKEYEYEQN